MFGFKQLLFLYSQSIGALSRDNSISLEQIPNMKTLHRAVGTTRPYNNTTEVPFKFDLFNTQV